MPTTTTSRTTTTLLGPQRSLWQQPSGKKKIKLGRLLLWVVLVAIALAYGLWSLSWSILRLDNTATTTDDIMRLQQQQQHMADHDSNHAALELPKKDETPLSSSSPWCRFRRYPDHRYYRLHHALPLQPSFLVSHDVKGKQVEYLYGAWPQVLPILPGAQKLCVNQSAWEKLRQNNKWPFADGTNPSILSIERYQHEVDADASQFPHNTRWLATVCMTNSQCAWNDSPAEIRAFNISEQSSPSTVQTVLLWLDDQFQTLQQATIQLEVDAPYGKQRKRLQPRTTSGDNDLHTLALDDARLFVYGAKLWVSYREGPRFGYDVQVLNPVHITNVGKMPRVVIKASETTTLCCGRNMALLTTPNDKALQALTWVDPVTVVTVDTTPLLQQTTTTTINNKKNSKRRRRLSSEESSVEEVSNTKIPSLSFFASSLSDTHHHHRILRSSGNKKKSHMHGTNAFMVYLEDRHEYLGVAHVHRPPGRQQNAFAKFGHHYTHAFYTIGLVQANQNGNNYNAVYELRTLSPEFVLPSQGGAAVVDAEVIQFVSGLEISEGHVVLAYGINDCEGAAVRVAYDWLVEKWLRPVVPSSQQVVDLMQPLDLSTMPQQQS